jgi:hypothetical protein
MDNPTPEQAAYIRAAEIADVLLRDGLPVIGFTDVDYGKWVAMTFRLAGQRAEWAVQVPVHKATPELFRELYEGLWT